jgi:catechol 2,3-dioxygenase-like lactoylglutathione lyase family enzyme
MLRGFATVSYWAADLPAARKWYAELRGIEPDFERPGYAEFLVGDYQHELGLIDSGYAPGGAVPGPGGAVIYWHVDDVPATFAKLLAMGATEYEAPQDRGAGFITASVVDRLGTSWASCTTRTIWRFWTRSRRREPHIAERERDSRQVRGESLEDGAAGEQFDGPAAPWGITR